MAYWRLYYHFVWAAYQRNPVINADMQLVLFDYIRYKTNKLECIFHAVGGVEDHVHLVVSIPPKFAVADVIRQIKGGSSHYINTEYQTATKFSWQNEYGVLSFGKKQFDDIVDYVIHQPQRHAHQQLHSVLERTTDK